jgi:hypothetical protein
MFQRNAVAAALAFALVLATLLLIPARASAGAPLKGVDVKLGREPGGGAAARTLDGDGKVDFGVLPKGSYYVILVPHQPESSASSTERLRAAPVADLKTASITIEGAVGGPIQMDWDFEKGKAFDPKAPATARAAADAGRDRIVFESDGQHHALFGAVVKSRSNMANT